MTLLARDGNRSSPVGFELNHFRSKEIQIVSGFDNFEFNFFEFDKRANEFGSFRVKVIDF